MFAVIGAGYGDEGKGLVTDYLASQNPDYTVVRSNGGAQAAHTVQLADGKRHVFSHFGSGTLAGTKTHLSRFMIVNPIQFRKEHQVLGCPRISVSPECLVTIPQDMLLNQIKEQARGAMRHGSCGMGINETVVRHEKANMIVAHLPYMNIHGLRAERARIPLLPKYIDPEYSYNLLDNDGILESYLDDVQYFLQNVDIIPDDKVDVNLIFEGAQGLGLDQNGEDFPHVTRSNTGITNINSYTNNAPIDAYYVTRCYVSRHGAGPLMHEGELAGVNVIDPTNQPNPWQGSLRTAPLDLDILKRRIEADLTPNVRPKLVVTCLDQIQYGAFVPIYTKGEKEVVQLGTLLDIIQRDLGIPIALASFGPTRDDIVNMAQ